MSARGLRLLAVGAWAAAFLWLWRSGSDVRYVGARTAWVVPFGAVAMTAAAAGLLLTRGTVRRLATRGELLGTVALLAPLVAVAAAPAATLGAFAVARKGDARSVAALPLPLDHGPQDPPNLFDVAVGGKRPDVARRLQLTPGRPVTLTGLVSATAGSHLDLSRLLTNCCAADALAYTVAIDATGKVDPDDPFPTDTWLRVTGTLQPGPDGFVVDATGVEEVDAPDDPYAALG